MKHGARNDIVGEVVEINATGGVMAQAKVKVSGEFSIASVMTKESLAALELAEGDQVRVLIKAVNVLLLKDELEMPT